MNSESEFDAATVLEQFRLLDEVYLLGTFEPNLTIYSQQVRALNFVWSFLNSHSAKPPESIAVIGGGFAGLTAAAGLLKMGIPQVSIFEKRATLLPLQQGSDARWVHPRIYDWPDSGSDLPVAALPLLNWNAGRASDVVVQVLTEWDKLIDEMQNRKDHTNVEVFVNVRHLSLASDLELEWVGERYHSRTRAAASGSKRKFQCALLAVGFGLELNAPFSYWRNETLGQPELDLGRRTYLVSGHGDGALVDLFRIRISQFRQDRMLSELFDSNSRLATALKELKRAIDNGSVTSDDIYDRFERVAKEQEEEFSRVLSSLRTRLRADTVAVLRMNQGVDRFEKAFRSRASFQNRFLLYCLYRIGGIIPTPFRDPDEICAEYGILKSDVISRHGPDRMKGVREVMDSSLEEACKKRLEFLKENSKQPSRICWPGGYWDPGKRSDKEGDSDGGKDFKAQWRREHLPAATEIMVTAFISGIAGYLESIQPPDSDFRVTLHRIIRIGSEVLLQQSSRYVGNTSRRGDQGRVFELKDATIGYAARNCKAVRSKHIAAGEPDSEYRDKLQKDKDTLGVESHAQKMPDDVRSVVALPILAADGRNVIAVLYADSKTPNVFSNGCIDAVSKMCGYFAGQIELLQSERVRNFAEESVPTTTLPTDQKIELEVMETVELGLPRAASAQQLNVEFTDFISPKGSTVK